MPGDRLRTWRKKNKFTSKEVAEKIGLTPSGLTKYETGKSDISGKYLIKLNEEYGLSIDWLLTGSGSQSGSSLPEDRKQLLHIYEQLSPERRSDLIDTAQMYLNKDKGNEQQSSNSQMAG